MIEPEVGDVVRVRWLDPAYRYEVRKSDFRRFVPTPIVTYGQVVKVKDDWFWIAHEVMSGSSEYDYRGVTVLIKALVEEYTVYDGTDHMAEGEVPGPEGIEA